MVNINSEACERNGIETIVDSDGIIWLNEKDAEEGLDHKSLPMVTREYSSKYRKFTYDWNQRSNQIEYF